ncbi:hypothetical protein [Nocardioides caricicola]
MGRRRTMDPVAERRRRHLVQGVALGVLVAVAAVLVVLALHRTA